MEDESLNKAKDTLAKFFDEHSIEQKEAICYNKTVIYFQNDDFEKFIESNSKEITNIISGSPLEKSLKSKEDIKKFISSLLQYNVIWKLERPTEATKTRWPSEVTIPADYLNQADNALYSFIHLKNNRLSNKARYFFIFVFLILLVFPFWPSTFKLASVYFVVISFYLMFALTCLRIIIQGIFRIFGYKAILFPNIVEEVSFTDSFYPIYSFEKCVNDGVLALIGRSLIAIIISYGIYIAPQNIKDAEYWKDGSIFIFEATISWIQTRLGI